MTKTVNDLLKEFEELCRYVREIHGDDTVCGYCEYDAGFIGEELSNVRDLKATSALYLKNHFVKSMKLGRIRRNKQMRLIDADKLIKDVMELWDYKTVDGITATTVLKQTITDIENQPTVKAIPIEWFEWLLDTMGDGMYNLRAVIKDWERYKEDWGKENEIN